MSRHGEDRNEIRKLVGGYATGSLTDAERKLLMDAALDDQDLFDELMREQELKALLDQPGAKPRLIAAVSPRQRRSTWMWGALAGVSAAALITLVLWFPREPEAEPVPMAKVDQPEPASPAVAETTRAGDSAVPAARSAPAPAPQVSRKEEAPNQEKASARADAEQDRRIAVPVAAQPPVPVASPPPPRQEAKEPVLEGQNAGPVAAGQAPVVVAQGPAAAAEGAGALGGLGPPPPPPATAPKPLQANAPPPPPPAATKGQAIEPVRQAAPLLQANAVGTVSGTVSDPSGAAIPDVAVTATNQQTGASFAASSSPTGAFTLPNLPVGQYRLGATQAGFRQFQTAFAVGPQQTARLDIELQVGQSTESVTIVADATALRAEAPPAVGPAGGKGGAKGGAAKAGPVPFGITYALNGLSLRLTPLVPGVMLVNAQAPGQTVAAFPRNPVVAGTPIVLALPGGTTEVTVAFAASAGVEPAEPRRLTDLAGTISGPPAQELRFVIPVR